MNERVVYLIRGFPSCGKSFTARRLAGASGVVCETDEYFYTQVGADPTSYDYDHDLLPKARRWNLERFQNVVASGLSPIVVDRGNGRNAETREYVCFAIDHGYRVELCEPESAWWQEIRGLLESKNDAGQRLDQWAERLAEMSRATHRVPVSTIRSWMANWRPNLTVDDILNYTAPS
ncbi:MAG TPA: AAA family ATPase [Pirellulaceae bacterium]